MMEEKFERVIVEGVSKKFTRKFKKNKKALAKFVSFFSPAGKKIDFNVLDNISFKVSSGENLGIIGRNGAGKSTLLRILAGIYLPDRGLVKTNGRLIYVTGFGQGLKSKLTMRENIYLVGSVMGLSKRDMDSKLDEIVDFSGLGDYLDTQVYQFSSGMLSRLSFSISIHCLKHQNPDILLFDEVLGGGGDITFHEKSMEKMDELIKGGATVIMVSHGLSSIKKYCDRAILLDDGKIVKEGSAKEVVDFYIKTRGKK